MSSNKSLKKFHFNPTPQEIEVEFIKWQDREIPRTIYKYRSWNNKYHQRVINNLELYFPPAQELNDPFDCQRNFDWEELLDPVKHRKYVYIAAERVARINNFTLKEKEQFIADGLLQKMDLKTITEMEQMVKEHDDWINSLQGTFTSSLVRDSILLWSHYADSHKGFCVGLDTELLLHEIKHGGSAKEAEYSPKLVLTSMLEDIVAMIAEKIFSKCEMWGYEFEYRILAGQLKKNKVFPSPKVFKEIIFGINMPQEQRRFIMYKAKRKIPEIQFFEAKKVRNEYRIEIAPL